MGRFLAFAIGLWLVSAAVLSAAERITVFAAASLRGALDEIAQSYDKSHDRRVILSFGGSGAMARQISEGAPADLVILANPEWMTWLEDQGVPITDGPLLITGNRLVVISHRPRPAIAAKDLPALLGADRLAIGQRDAVPVGSYTREWLTHAGLWAALEPRLAEMDNVRAVLTSVARGDVPFGVVYATDALAEPGVTVVYEVPASEHSPVVYPAAALSPAGNVFLKHLMGPAAQDIFAAHGYVGTAP